MTLLAEILLVWIVGVPSAIVAYAALGQRYFDWRLARRHGVVADAPVVSISVARRRRGGAAPAARRDASLSA